MLMSFPERGYDFNQYLIDPGVMGITRFVIYDETKRRHGWGTALYQEWERALPPDIISIYLRAITPAAEAFWTRMGFVRKYQSADLCQYEMGGIAMIKPHIRPINQAAT